MVFVRIDPGLYRKRRRSLHLLRIPLRTVPRKASLAGRDRPSEPPAARGIRPSAAPSAGEYVPIGLLTPFSGSAVGLPLYPLHPPSPRWTTTGLDRETATPGLDRSGLWTTTPGLDRRRVPQLLVGLRSACTLSPLRFAKSRLCCRSSVIGVIVGRMGFSLDAHGVLDREPSSWL